jgi:hypothetical protein
MACKCNYAIMSWHFLDSSVQLIKIIANLPHIHRHASTPIKIIKWEVGIPYGRMCLKLLYYFRIVIKHPENYKAKTTDIKKMTYTHTRTHNISKRGHNESIFPFCITFIYLPSNIISIFRFCIPCKL